MWDHMQMDWHGWGGHMFGWWGILVIFFLIIAVVFVITRIDSSGTQTQQPSSAGDSPLDILEKRYARGEIDREEFEQKKADLEES